MSLIRFDSTTDRGPTAQLWAGLVDWVSGSLSTYLGQRDFQDFTPFLGPILSGAVGQESGTQVASLAGSADVSKNTTRFGGVSFAEAAGTDECVGVAREVWYDIQVSDLTVIEVRVDVNPNANTPQTFVGFCAEANPDDVFASGVIASGGSEAVIGILWNGDETFDIVACDDGNSGLLTVIKNDIGAPATARTDGFVKIGLRIEKVTATLYRLVPSINGSIVRSGITKVASTVMPEAAMRPTVACTVAATTAPDIDIDYIYSADK